MSYTILQEDTTITASDINQNFSLSAGNLLPFSGSTLTATTDTYDIGSSTYKWKDVWCSNVHMKGNFLENYWNLITEIILSATASQVSVSGLNGENTEVLWITFKAITTATVPSIYLHFNADTSTNYGYRNALSTIALTTTVQSGTDDGIVVGKTGYGTTTALNSYSENYLYIGKGDTKAGIVNAMMSCVGVSQPYINQVQRGGASWSSSDTVTSIQIEVSASTLATNTSIQIWGKSKS